MFMTLGQLEAGLDHIKSSPNNNGTVEKIVIRPDRNERRELHEGRLDVKEGLLGDNWLRKGYRKTPDGQAHPGMQLTLMNARAIALIAAEKVLWQLAGDQFYVDLDLSSENLPPGTQLQIGDAVIEITAEPHLGCGKFSDRFGQDAVQFVNSESGIALNLRGVNAKVVQPGTVITGSVISKLNP